jgi:hypothetical protein
VFGVLARFVPAPRFVLGALRGGENALLRALAVSKVTAGHVEALRRANIGNLSADDVSALRAYGIDQVFIEGLAAKGHHSLSIDDVVGLYISG